MACHICKHDGTRTCDPEEAAIKCSICGRCGGWVAEAPQEPEIELPTKWSPQNA